MFFLDYTEECMAACLAVAAQQSPDLMRDGKMSSVPLHKFYNTH